MGLDRADARRPTAVMKAEIGLMKGGNYGTEILLPMVFSLSFHGSASLRFTDDAVHDVHMMYHILTECAPSAYPVHIVSSLGQEGEEHLG